jgi:hypothetical protein
MAFHELCSQQGTILVPVKTDIPRVLLPDLQVSQGAELSQLYLRNHFQSIHSQSNQRLLLRCTNLRIACCKNQDRN